MEQTGPGLEQLRHVSGLYEPGQWDQAPGGGGVGMAGGNWGVSDSKRTEKIKYDSEKEKQIKSDSAKEFFHQV